MTEANVSVILLLRGYMIAQLLMPQSIAAKIKLIAVSAISSAIILLGAALYIYISSLQQEIKIITEKNITLSANNKILQENINVIKENLKTVSESNQKNLETVQMLLAERVKAQQVIDSLSTSKSNNKQTIDKLNKKLDFLLKDPKNDGKVSPSLRETIREIQKSRITR